MDPLARLGEFESIEFAQVHIVRDHLKVRPGVQPAGRFAQQGDHVVDVPLETCRTRSQVRQVRCLGGDEPCQLNIPLR